MHAKKLILLAAAIEIGCVGALYLVAPRFMLAANNMTIATVNDAHLVRAAYGGAFVAFGCLFAAGALSTPLTRPALISLAAFMSGFAIGRVTSIIADGVPGGLFLAVLGTEIIFAVGATYLLAREGPSRETGRLGQKQAPV